MLDEGSRVRVLSRAFRIGETVLYRWLSQYRQRLGWTSGIAGEGETPAMRALRQSYYQWLRRCPARQSARAGLGMKVKVVFEQNKGWIGLRGIVKRLRRKGLHYCGRSVGIGREL